MTPFHQAVTALWGEKWRKPLAALLKKRGMVFTSRSTFGRWERGERKTPGGVMHLLEKELKATKRKQTNQPERNRP
jgi:hypothetical protein